MKRPFVLIALIPVLLAACGPVTPAVTPTTAAGVLSVDPKIDLGPISPYVYGANYSMYGTVPAGRMEEALNSHVTTLRFPGGSWGEKYDLMDYQIDMFMNFCKQLGAMPTVSARLLNSTPEAAANLVRYINIQQKYGVVYWSIGSEPDDFYTRLPGANYDIARFDREWRAIALAMKAVDPSSKLLGPELSQWGTSLARTPKYPPTKTPTGQERQDWMTEFLKANGDLVDVVTVHRYPMYAPNDPNPVTVERLRQNTPEWGPMVTYLRDMVHRLTGRDLPFAFTEVNSDPSDVVGGVASTDSYYNAIWYADVLGRLIQQNVFMVNYWALASTGGLGLLTINDIRPTYYVFQMYSHFGSKRVYSSSGVDFITVYAAKRADGTLTVMVINLTDSEQRVPLQVKGVTLSKADVWLFDATHKAEDQGQKTIPSDGLLDLPAQSISLYILGK